MSTSIPSQPEHVPYEQALQQTEKAIHTLKCADRPVKIEKLKYEMSKAPLIVKLFDALGVGKNAILLKKLQTELLRDEKPDVASALATAKKTLSALDDKLSQLDDVKDAKEITALGDQTRKLEGQITALEELLKGKSTTSSEEAEGRLSRLQELRSHVRVLKLNAKDSLAGRIMLALGIGKEARNIKEQTLLKRQNTLAAIGEQGSLAMVKMQTGAALTSADMRVLAGVVKEQQGSAITPSVALNDGGLELSELANGIVAMGRTETVPLSDPSFKGTGGKHTDDSVTARTFQDGTVSLACTDGEGAMAGSDIWSHHFNETLQDQLAAHSLAIRDAAQAGNQQEINRILDSSCAHAFDVAKAKQQSHVAEHHLNKQKEVGGTTLALVKSVQVADAKNSVAITGMIVYDSAVAVYDPSQGKFTHVHTDEKAKNNVNIGDGSWQDYMNRVKEMSTTGSDAMPKTFYQQVGSDSILNVFSDGVIDTLPVDDQEQRNIAEALTAIVSTSYFDTIPDSMPPATVTISALNSMTARSEKTPPNELTPVQIRNRVLNYTVWRTKTNREFASQLTGVEAAMGNKKNTIYNPEAKSNKEALNESDAAVYGDGFKGFGSRRGLLILKKTDYNILPDDLQEQIPYASFDGTELLTPDEKEKFRNETAGGTEWHIVVNAKVLGEVIEARRAQVNPNDRAKLDGVSIASAYALASKAPEHKSSTAPMKQPEPVVEDDGYLI